MLRPFRSTAGQGDRTTAAILVINPGSLSTRTALFEHMAPVADEFLACPADELTACATVLDQAPMRTRHVRDFLARHGRTVGECDAIAARGGPLRPVPGGVYRVNDALLADARSDRFVEHVSKVACIIADALGRDAGRPAFIVDPVSTDEFDSISRVSGLPAVPRKSLVHALNLRAVARAYAAEIGRPYAELNLITAHLGGGCSMAVHARGRMIDAGDANGEGPFSPERSGGLRVDDLARFVIESGKPFKEIRGLLTRRSGLVGHLGTADAREVEARVAAGDQAARLVYEAMAYGMAKHICALAAAVNGRVDAILLTGGLARSEMLVRWIEQRVSFLAPVRTYPGEREMQALRDGVARVLAGEEPARVYPSGEFEA